MSGQRVFSSQPMLSLQTISEPLTQQQNEDKGIFWLWLWHNADEKVFLVFSFLVLFGDFLNLGGERE